MTRSKFLITGGAGFIGSNLVELLLERGYYVRVLDNFSTGKKENLSALSHEIDLREGDVRNASDCRAALREITHVVHLAAEVSVARSIVQPLETTAINVGGTCNLLEEARLCGVEGFVFASTCAVYGDNASLPILEESEPRPLSPYAVSKLSAEHYLRLYRQLYGLSTVVFRLFNVYGPKQDPGSAYSGVISAFADRLKKGVSPTIYGDGEQTRDFIFVRDVAEAFFRGALNAQQMDHEAYNLATGISVSVNELYRLMNELMKKELSPISAPARNGEVRHSRGSSERYRACSEFQPVPLSRGLKVTTDWFSGRGGHATL